MIIIADRLIGAVAFLYVVRRQAKDLENKYSRRGKPLIGVVHWGKEGTNITRTDSMTQESAVKTMYNFASTSTAS